ncbi:MAG: hypothetical protein ACU0DI_14400 [Paracoccaceae bacterium]
MAIGVLLTFIAYDRFFEIILGGSSSNFLTTGDRQFSILVIGSLIGIFILPTIDRVYQVLTNQLGLETEKSFYQDQDIQQHSSELVKRLETISSRLVDSGKSRVGTTAIELSATEKKKLISQIIADSKIDLSDDAIKRLKVSALNERAMKIEDNALLRMTQQTSVLGKRANLNLLFGVGSAILGGGALLLSFFGPFTPLPSSNYLAFAENYLPRLALILIIEIVAFYFLRMYGRTLTALRFVQNEITNIESKLIALNHAFAQKGTGTIDGILQEFSRTERNFILEKGQTTAEIEKERADTAGMAATVSAAAELIHGKAQKKTSGTASMTGAGAKND